MQLARLARGDIDPSELQITNRVSKRVKEYTQQTRNVAALEQAADLGLDKHPGENVSYVVVDDEKPSRDRVRLAGEDVEGEEYDTEFYRTLMLRAAESVLSPLGWRRSEIETYLADREDAAISAY